MKNLYRVSCATLAILMIFSLIGCQSTPPSAASSSAASQGSEAPSSAPELEPVELTAYYIGDGQPAGADAVNAAISEYVKDKINATVTLTQYDWDSFSTRMTTMAAANEPFDITFTCSWAFNYRMNAQKGAFWELTDERLETYAPNALNVVGKGVLEGAKVDGKVYALPVNKEKAHTFGVLFNKALVDKYSIDISAVKTMQDLTPLLKTIKDNEREIIPYYANRSGGAMMTSACFFEPVSGVGKIPAVIYANNDPTNTKVFNRYETEEFKQYLTTMREWYQAGYILKDAATITSEGEYVNTGMVFAYPSQLLPGKDVSMKTDMVEWVQKELTPVQTSNMDIGGSMMAVSNTSKNPERALMLLDLMYSDDTLMNMIVYGVEGQHYNMDSNGFVVPVENNDYANASVAWEFGNNFLLLPKVGDDPKKWETIEAFNASSTILNCTGFQYDAEKMTSEIAALTQISDQYLPMLVTGSVDPDSQLPAFLDAMRQSGWDKVLADIQSQYDAFLAAK